MIFDQYSSRFGICLYRKRAICASWAAAFAYFMGFWERCVSTKKLALAVVPASGKFTCFACVKIRCSESCYHHYRYPSSSTNHDPDWGCGVSVVSTWCADIFGREFICVPTIHLRPHSPQLVVSFVSYNVDTRTHTHYRGRFHSRITQFLRSGEDYLYS